MEGAEQVVSLEFGFGIARFAFHPCYGSKPARIPALIISDLHKDMVTEESMARMIGQS
jgi:hypothetical protein